MTLCWKKFIGLVLGGLMSLVSIHAQSVPVLQAKPVAKVNGQELTRAAWDQAVLRLPPVPAHFTEQQRLALHHELLGLMVDEMLFRQFLNQNVQPPEQAQVDQRITELENSLKARKMTLNEYLTDSKQTMEQLRSGIAQELQWQRYLAQRLEKVDLKEYYEQNKEMFDGVVIRVSHLALPLPPKCSAKDEAAAMAQMQSIHKELSAGLDFAAAVKKYVQEGSTIRGGDLGYFPPRRSDQDPFIRTASHLKVGQISDIVRSDFGLHLLKVTDRKEGQPSDYESIKDSVRAVYGDDLRMQIIMQQRKTAKIEVNLP